MKRKLALFMVLAMLISLVPMNVFAATSNSVNKVPTVAEDHDFGDVYADAPRIRLEETYAGELNGTQTFRLKLDNAEWDTESAALKTAIEANDFGTATATVTVTTISDTTYEIKLVLDNDNATEYYMNVPLFTVVDAAGVAKVIVEDWDSSITEGSYTFAKVADGDTKVTYDADDVDAFSDTVTLGDLMIEELSIGTLSSGTLKLKLINSDFSWDLSGDSLVKGGGFATAGIATANAATLESDQIINVVFDVDNAVARGSITLKDLVVEADSDATFGDVKVKVYGDDITDETIVVAKYSDYAVTVEADDEAADLPEVYAGFADTDATEAATGLITNTGASQVTTNSEDNELSVLWIKEDVAGTLDEGKRIKVTFPEWVNIMNVVVDADSENLGAGSEAAIELIGEANDNGNEFEFTVDKDVAADKYELGLQFYVTVEADAKGDIEASVTGKALNGETKKVVIGKAIAPVTMTVETKDVKLGLKDQAVGKVTITEATDGVLAKDSTIVLDLDDIAITGTITAKVTKGDIELADPEKVGGNLLIQIDTESSEASTIEISGIEVDLDRTLAEGTYDINLMGGAVVMNNDGEGDDFFFDNDTMASAAFARVITPAPGDTTTGETVVFTIGAADYMVGATKMTSDAAPYINEQGRTMLPLRALANALGVTDANIMWNEVERSVTIFKGDATIKVVIGQMSFVKNGVVVPMDTMAMIMNSRTFLPIRAIGQALGADVTWDEATKTVTIK